MRPALKREPFDRLQEIEGLFRKYGAKYGFDWLLLASFAYQESRLDQRARSPVGAVGIMQVLPSTAQDRRVGIKDIENLENNIHAGTKYLSVLRDRYFADGALDSDQRAFFIMAGYNAGPNRINRLRKKAAERKLDPNRWFNNVELVVAAKVGREPVQYVGNIYKYYIAFKRALANRDQKRLLRSPEKVGHISGAAFDDGGTFSCTLACTSVTIRAGAAALWTPRRPGAMRVDWHQRGYPALEEPAR